MGEIFIRSAGDTVVSGSEWVSGNQNLSPLNPQVPVNQGDNPGIINPILKAEDNQRTEVGGKGETRDFKDPSLDSSSIEKVNNAF